MGAVATDTGWEPLRKAARAAGSGRFGRSPFSRLAIVHMLSAAGDTFVTLALAGSLFFSISPQAARGRVALYLVLTMAPFAVVAPFLGPVLDRSRRGRRWMLLGSAVARALVCISMAGHLQSLWLFPEAFLVLVLSKAHMVTKSALVPTTVADDSELVTANARLAVLAVLAGFAAAAIGVPVLKIGFLGGPWVVRLAALAFAAAAVAAVAAMRLQRPPARSGPEPAEAEEELHVALGADGGDGHVGAPGRRRIPDVLRRLRLPGRGLAGVVVRRGAGGQPGRDAGGQPGGPQAAAPAVRGADAARVPGPRRRPGRRRRLPARAPGVLPGGGGDGRGRGRRQAGLRQHRAARRPRRRPGPHVRPVRDPVPAGVGGRRLRTGGPAHLAQPGHRRHRPRRRADVLRLRGRPGGRHPPGPALQWRSGSRPRRRRRQPTTRSPTS